MDNGTFCSAFWKHTNLRPGDRIYPCCRFKHSISTFDGDVENILHIPEYKELRAKSLAGEKIPGCNKCYYEESIGHKSLRQEFNEEYDSNKINLEYLEIGLDNLCNLACIGCGSEFSTSWIQKEIDTLGYALNKYMAVRDINKLPHTIKKILFLGGEPLLTKRFVPMLQSLNENRSVQVIFNTNGTCIPDDETVEILSKHNTHFILSIDGVDKMANEVREGTNWSKVTEFIEWVETQDFSLEINTVLHKANWWDIGNIAAFVKQLDTQWYVNILTNPSYLDIQQLNDREKSKLSSLITNCDLPNQDLIINHLFQTMS